MVDNKTLLSRAKAIGIVNKQTIPLVTQTNDSEKIIGIMSLFEMWTPRAFAVGDTVVWNDQPVTCAESYDGLIHPDWTPEGYPAGWRIWHGRTVETALPYIMRHAEDRYMTDEYITWGDEDNPPLPYKCLADNVVHNPIERPDVWEAIVQSETIKNPEEDDAEEPTIDNIPQWHMPQPGVDPYIMAGDKYRHNDVVYASNIDYNTTVPGSDKRWWTEIV